jgi:two-component system, cell cycle sensor histidine kinase and response regulator CckA
MGSRFRKDDDVLAVVAETQQRIAEAGADVDAVLHLVAGQAQRITGADGAVVEMREGDEMVYRAAVGSVAAHVGLRLKVASSLSGHVMMTERPVLCVDAQTDSRVDGAAAATVGARSMILLPLRDLTGTVGVMQVLSPEPDTFDERDMKTLQVLAGLMSISIAVAAEKERSERLSRRLQAIFDAAPDAIYSMNVEGRITLWGPSAQELLGWRADEVVGLQPPFIPTHERAQFAERMALVMSGDTLRSWETVHCSPSGELIDIRLSAAPKRTASGEVAGTACFAHDIREEKRLQARLFQSQRLETIGRLAGGIAHDFNNMLTAISGFSRLLLTDPSLGPDQKDSVEEILAAAKRSSYITHQLLAYSRRQVLSPRSLDLNTILQGMRGIAGQLLGKNIAVEMILAPDLWPISADRGQIEQVLLNLLANARDAFGTEPGRVIVQTANVVLGHDDAEAHDLPQGQYVRLVVRDTGPGIPEHVLKHIFEPFYTTKQLTEGTGLGLATVEGVVRQTGGSVHVASEVGAGTTFEIYLPRGGDAGPPDPAVSHKAASGAHSLILVVEDEAPVRNLMRKVLERGGHEVVTAASPLEALGLLAASGQSFHLVVSDVVMPDMSGFALWKRARETWPDLPFLFVSGYVEEQLDQSAHRDGSAFLSKPFSPDELLAAVQGLRP